MRFGCDLRVFLGTENYLGEAFAVAQVDKNHAAVIATRMHPAGERGLLADVSDAESVAVVGAIHDTQKGVSF